MADYQLVIIGGGLSGIAAGIRAARFGLKTIVLEQHNKPGGLNSYYYRKGHLFESGLHAMTNFAPVADKRAPLNLLFRQLKLSRKSFTTHEQLCSEIRFPGTSLLFSNDSQLLEEEIRKVFPEYIDRFVQLNEKIATFDPFAIRPWQSARDFLHQVLGEPALEEMLLLPLMVYGNAEEHDMELAQFVIMYRAIFGDGFFRPSGTIRDFLEQLTSHFKDVGGEIRYNTRVATIDSSGDQVSGVSLADGTRISAEKVVSTIGIPATIALSGWQMPEQDYIGQMSFMETVSVLPKEAYAAVNDHKTILFFNNNHVCSYRRPVTLLDLSWGVVCFPQNFQGMKEEQAAQLRVTHAANYDLWKALPADQYQQVKEQWTAAVIKNTELLVGSYGDKTLFQDSFTPLTIERYTEKAAGAVYGSPVKIKDGKTPWQNLFVAGTDQGYLGIVGSMLSGVTMVNHHIL